VVFQGLDIYNIVGATTGFVPDSITPKYGIGCNYKKL